MKIKKINIILLMVLGSLFSCDFDLDKLNPNEIPFNGYYKNAGELGNAVTATYAVLQSRELAGREWFFLHDLRSDDMMSGGGHLEAHRAQLLNGAHLPSNGIISQVWSAYYGMIFRANIVMDEAPDIEMDADLKSRYVGEVKFLRAYAYLELVSMWGDVPIVTEVAKTADVEFPSRSPQQEVYDLIEQDLTDAIAVLPQTYDAADAARATEGAARALLARAYMQQGDYASAKTQLRAVYNMQGTVYNLVDRYNDNFEEENEFNEESVFEIAYMAESDKGFGWGGSLGNGKNIETTLRCQEYCAVAWRNVQPSQSMLDEYELDGDYPALTKDDPRIDHTYYFDGELFAGGQDTVQRGVNVRAGPTQMWKGVETQVSWQKWSLMYKYNTAESDYNPSGVNIRVIRFAEVILNLAECILETEGNVPEVLDLMNEIRGRADVQMPTYPIAGVYPCDSYDETFRALVHERRVELACECIRDLDILRWRKHGKLDYEPLSYYTSKQNLLPIPENEILNNYNIGQEGQNPGY